MLVEFVIMATLTGADKSHRHEREKDVARDKAGDKAGDEVLVDKRVYI